MKIDLTRGGITISILQKGPEGRFLITVPAKLIEAKNWKKGQNMVFLVAGPHHTPKDGDVIIRRKADRSL